MNDRVVKVNYMYIVPEPAPLSEEQVKVISDLLEETIYEDTIALFLGNPEGCSLKEMVDCVHKSYDKVTLAVNLEACP